MFVMPGLTRQIYIDVIAGLTRNPWWLTQSAAPVTWMPDQVRHDKSHRISGQRWIKPAMTELPLSVERFGSRSTPNAHPLSA
jgi:hypothetical protein